MGKPLTPKQATTSIDYVIDVMERLKRDVAEMIRRAEHEAVDGYPASSMGGTGGGQGPSDPTIRAALLTPPQDWVRSYIFETLRLLEEVDERARGIEGRRGRVMSVADEERGRQSSIRTRVCANPFHAEEIPPDDPGKRGRCRACAEFLRRTDRDRPRDLIDRYNARRAEQ